MFPIPPSGLSKLYRNIAHRGPFNEFHRREQQTKKAAAMQEKLLSLFTGRRRPKGGDSVSGRRESGSGSLTPADSWVEQQDLNLAPLAPSKMYLLNQICQQELYVWRIAHPVQPDPEYRTRERMATHSCSSMAAVSRGVLSVIAGRIWRSTAQRGSTPCRPSATSGVCPPPPPGIRIRAGWCCLAGCWPFIRDTPSLNYGP
jgi:hypothetical protein